MLFTYVFMCVCMCEYTYIRKYICIIFINFHASTANILWWWKRSFLSFVIADAKNNKIINLAKWILLMGYNMLNGILGAPLKMKLARQKEAKSSQSRKIGREWVEGAWTNIVWSFHANS